MPFKKGNLPDTLDENRYHMSVRDIAKELGTTKNDISYVLRTAIAKLRKPKYQYLEDYQYDYPEQKRESTCTKH